MKVSLILEKEYSVTAFSEAISTFLNEDTSFKENTDPLETKLLLLEGVNFQLSHNRKTCCNSETAPI